MKIIKYILSYTQYGGSGTGLVGRYQNFAPTTGTVDIKFGEGLGQTLKEHENHTEHLTNMVEIVKIVIVLPFNLELRNLYCSMN